MHVVQTEALPPSRGRTILPTIGSTRKRSDAPRKVARAKVGMTGRRLTGGRSYPNRKRLSMAAGAPLRERLAGLPDRPGVYLYRNAAGKLLYVGKAKSLRSRVRSYFQASAGHPPRTAQLVAEVHDL